MPCRALSRVASARRPSRTGRTASCVAFALLVAWGTAAGADEAETRVSGKELVELGFFQDFDELDLGALLEADEITLEVASLRAETLERAPGAVSVVEDYQIRNLGARTLEDVLRSVPDFDVVIDNLGRNRIVVRGQPGFVGGSSENVLLLLNGHRLNESINGGATAINLNLPADAIRRVEIVRGPASAVYGSGALAAVVNVLTFGPDDFEGLGAAVGYGSFDTKDLMLRVSGELKSVKVAGFINFTDTDGPRLDVARDAQTFVDRDHPEREPISLAPGRTTDDMRTLETLYTVQFHDLELNWRVKQERFGGFVGATNNLGRQNDLNNKQTVLDLGYARSLSDGTQLRGRLGWTQNQIRRLFELVPPDFEIEFAGGRTILPSGVLLQESLDTDRLGAELVAERDLPGGHALTAGLNLEREATGTLETRGNVDPVTNRPFDEGLEPIDGLVRDESRTLLGVFAQDSFRLDSPDVGITVGLRLDHASDVGTLVSPRLAAVWALPHGLNLKTTYARGFRWPAFAELYFDLPGTLGNPDLEPTRSDTLDVGLAWRSDEWELRGSTYYSRVRDTIQPEAPPSLFEPSRLVNGEGIDAIGVGVQARRLFGVNAAFASLSLVHSEDVGTASPVAGVPALMGSVGASLEYRGRYRVTPRMTFRSSRPRAQADIRDDLGGYVVFDVNFEVRNVVRKLDLRATVRNLFDRHYFDPAPVGGLPGDYPRPGFSLMLDASYRF